MKASLWLEKEARLYRSPTTPFLQHVHYCIYTCISEFELAQFQHSCIIIELRKKKLAKVGHIYKRTKKFLKLKVVNKKQTASSSVS